jgi:arsenite-transporting ATPase
VIVYDGINPMVTLRMAGLPEVLDWYVRRFRGVFQQSDLVRVLSPFIQPISAAVLATDWSGDIWDKPTGRCDRCWNKAVMPSAIPTGC